MKKLLFAICGSALLWAGCKEHDTPVDFGTSLPTAGDTTYVITPVPTATAHQVLVEEFTGQSCPNCPAAHADLDGQAATHPVNVVSMYVSGSPQTNPPAGSSHDFRDSIAFIISGTTIYGGVGAWPSAGIDRTPVSGALLQIGNSSWDNIISNQLNIKDDSVNLSVSSTYDSTTQKASIVAMITYTHPVSTPQNLSIVIVEDSIYDKQEDGTAPGGYQDNYLFLDVFRGMATSVTGDALQVTNGNNTKEAGRFFQKIYTCPLPVKTPAVIPAHCRVIAFVSNANGTDLHVMQSAQCKFAP